jgi:SagB-type dehydrogenase family enzyme
MAGMATLVPLQPRFIRDLVVLPLADETVVDGTDQLQVLRGESARRLLPRLIDLMDGSRTMAQVESALPEVPPDHVRKATSLLMSRGLLEEGLDEDAVGPPPNPQTLSFFRRFVGATGANRSGGDAYRRLSAREVMVLEPGDEDGSAQVLVEALSATGVPRVSLRSRTALDRLGAEATPSASRPLLVSLCLSGEDVAWHRELDDWARLHRACWLRAVLDEDEGYADLGPFFVPEVSACYRCLHAVHARCSDRAARARPRMARAAGDLWAAMVAIEVLYHLSGIGPAIGGRGFRRYDLGSWNSKDLVVPRLPGCPCRSAGDGPPDGTRVGEGPDLIDTALVFEDYVGLESAPALPSHGLVEMARLAGMLLGQAKSLPVCPQVPLRGTLPALEGGVLDVVPSHGPASEASFTVARLAAVLQMTAGIRHSSAGRLKRWAATAGNLGSVELFVAVRRVDGLEPGLYFYEPREDALAALRWRSGGPDADTFLAQALPGAGPPWPDALVVLTGAFHRLARKYGPFAYRLVQLDAGAAVSQMHLVARSLGLWARTARTWDDGALESGLGLEAPQEQSTAVVELWRSAPGNRDSNPERPARAGRPPSLRPARSFFECTAGDLVTAVHRDSRRTDKNASGGAFVVPADAGEEKGTKRAPLALPPPVSAGLSAGDVLERRATLRDYSPDPLRAEQLSTMLHHAHQGDATDWPEDQGSGRALELVILARRVEGIPPAMYVYDPASGGLRRTRELPSGEEAAGLFVQSEFPSAPLQVWVVGNLAAACARHGAWGHRQLLLRAGAASHRLWFAALATGAGGAIVAGCVPGAARASLGLDGRHRAALVVLIAGQEEADGARSEPEPDPVGACR